MIASADELCAAVTTHSYRTLAILAWFFRIGGFDHAFWFWDAPQGVAHLLQDFFLIEFAGDDQDGIVWLVVFFVESAEARDIDLFDV